MTEETLKKATELKKEIDWIDNVLHFLCTNETLLCFRGEPLPNITFRSCPDWLSGAIEVAARERRSEAEKELKEL